MAPGKVPRPDRQLQQPSLPPPDIRSKHAGLPFLRPAFNPQRSFWVEANKHRFHQLILFGEGQPSNGTVRIAEPSNGETRFNVAYGEAPDYALQALLECIYDRHGDVIIQHDGRDSTGKHWITCFNKVRPGTFEISTERAIICVSSKLELATVHSHRASEALRKGKGRAKQEWPPKVPGAVAQAPDYLFFMPWHRQLRWLEPAAAKALRERIEAQSIAAHFGRRAWGEGRGARRG